MSSIHGGTWSPRRHLSGSGLLAESRTASDARPAGRGAGAPRRAAPADAGGQVGKLCARRRRPADLRQCRHRSRCRSRRPSSVCGVSSIGVFVVLSETGVNDRFKDHYLTVLQVGRPLAILLGFLLARAADRHAFLNALFLIFGFAALRMTSRQAAMRLDAMALGIAGDVPADRHADRHAARHATWSASPRCCVHPDHRTMRVRRDLSAARCARSLYKRGAELNEAYKRIEELAELDELTGSFNRRCIMRMLDDEIARAAAAARPARSR